MPDVPEVPQRNGQPEQAQGATPPELIQPINPIQQQARTRQEIQQYMDRYAPEVRTENPEITKWNMNFVENWQRYFASRFSAKDGAVLNAIHSVDSFDEYVGLLRQKILEKRGVTQQTLDQDANLKKQIDIELSATVEREIIHTVSRLYIQVDQAKPDETFEEIVQADFMESIRLNFDKILQRLNLLKDEIARRSHSQTLPENLRGITFYKKYSEEEIKETIVDTKDGQSTRTIYSQRPVPTAQLIDVTYDEFIRYVYSQTNHYMNLRKYLHNVGVIFKRGRGEHGFWGKVAEYAKQMSTTDRDSIPLLPDADLFMTAHNLYIKHLTATFAKHSWINQPGMFSEDYFNIHTNIEEKVLEDLKRLNPQITQEDSWRLDRAVKMGVGIARGVTLAEVEIAASADPAMVFDSGKREVSYESFYISDSSALQAFRPLYNAERFIPPDLMKGPLWFMPVGTKKKEKFWNHNTLWERMKLWEESYIEGKKTEDGVTLLIDAMHNFGKVGAIEARSGWRFPRGYESWFRTKPYTKNNETRQVIDYLESWKQLENIGFIILRNFSSLIEGDSAFLKGTRFGFVGEREDFFKHLNDHYINFDPLTGRVTRSLSDEIASIRQADSKISDKDVYKLLLNKALYGVIRNRIPTYYIRLDRNRDNSDGIGAFERIRKGIDQQPWSAERLDKALRNLIDVETKLRINTSQLMHEHLSTHPKDLNNPNIKYIVDETTIRQILGELLGNDPNKNVLIEDAVSVFKYSHRVFLGNNNEFAKEKVAMFTDKKYQFTLANEEFDSSFVAYRAAGDTVLFRTLSDTAAIEAKVSENVVKYVEILKQTALNPEHDMSKLIETLSAIRTQISILHGDIEAWKRTSWLVGMTIDWFRKDSVGKAFWGMFGIGRKNSLAAEFVGTFRGVWEWENHDIHNFIIECERQRIIPKDSTLLQKPPEIVLETNPFLKLFRKYRKIEHDEDKDILTGKKVRELYGAKYFDIFKEYLWKYLPIILGFIAYAMLKKAFKDETESKR